MIPLSVPHVAGNEWKYVKECLDTGWVSSVGSYVDEFEKQICRFTEAKFAIACTNGTAALQAALRIVGVSPNDEVIVPTVTFIAPVNAVHYAGAVPVFMDCDRYYNIDVEKTVDFIKNETSFINGQTINKTTKRRISALVPVHIFGNAVDLEPLISICKEKNIKVVEDAAESIGAYYLSGSLQNKHTGTIGDIGCYSFNGNKIITTGGGGMIVTNDESYAEKARYLSTQAKDDPVRYIHNEIGYNFRLTNIQAAMGVAQLEKLPDFIEIKKKNYQLYKEGIDKIPGLHLAEVPDYANNNYWMYCVQIDKDIYGKNREELMAHLSDNGIQTRPVWYLNHIQKPYKNCQSYYIEKAYEMIDKTLNVPCSVNLSSQSIDNVLRSFKT